jgi:tRNA(Arg) A34 adenosine deaminase TadA
MATTDDIALMRRALAAARAGLGRGGGPFGALVADEHGHVVAVAANAVMVSNDPTAHAEVQAIRRATALRGSFLLHGWTLVTTCAPCVMCTGAIHWAGIARVIAGARSSDAESIGFVEGPVGFDGAAFLRARGIAYDDDVEREAAITLLRAYTGPIYNG